MNEKISYFRAIFICCIFILVTYSGCIEQEQQSEELKDTLIPKAQLDQPSVLPDWNDGDYHDYSGTMEMLNGFNDRYPELVNVISIGKSVLGYDIWCIRLT